MIAACDNANWAPDVSERNGVLVEAECNLEQEGLSPFCPSAKFERCG